MTKEMLIGPMAKDQPPLLSLCGATVEQVSVFKLLGVHVSSDLKWTKHTVAVVSKAASRLYFLKQLRRADVPTRDLLHFYTTVVWPVLQYCRGSPRLHVAGQRVVGVLKVARGRRSTSMVSVSTVSYRRRWRVGSVPRHLIFHAVIRV